MEIKWVPDWMPIRVISKSGVAEPECIFITPATPQNSIWIVSKHDPKNFNLEMYKITPEQTVAKLQISLSSEEDQFTKAIISYEYTAIGPEGEKFLKEFTFDWYGKFMADWEKELNYYLRNKEKFCDPHL
jgi:hypothetical protein